MVYNAIQWYTYTSVEIFTIQMIQMSGTHFSTQWRIFQYYTANTMVPSTNTILPSTTQWRIFQYYTTNTLYCHHLPPPPFTVNTYPQNKKGLSFLTVHGKKKKELQVARLSVFIIMQLYFNCNYVILK